MPLSLKDRKILWARSGNHCAFPGCRQALVECGGGNVADLVIGEEAHIVARRRDGPRGTDMSGDDTYGNMILLCPTHHRVVDEQPDVFSVETLLALKSAHELRIREWSLRDTSERELDPSDYRSYCDCERAWNAWRLGSDIVIACGFGSPPVGGPNLRWRGSGIAFVRIASGDAKERLLTSSEAEPDIEYWMEGASLHIVEYTVEPDSNLFMPLIEHVFRFDVTPAQHTMRTLIRIHSPHGVNAESIASELRSLSRDAPYGTAQLLLFRLRNAGWTDPEATIAIIESFRGLWWHDGANSEAAAGVQRELALIRDAE